MANAQAGLTLRIKKSGHRKYRSNIRIAAGGVPPSLLHEGGAGLCDICIFLCGAQVGREDGIAYACETEAERINTPASPPPRGVGALDKCPKLSDHGDSDLT